jgi:hypothetical protein
MGALPVVMPAVLARWLGARSDAAAPVRRAFDHQELAADIGGLIAGQQSLQPPISARKSSLAPRLRDTVVNASTATVAAPVDGGATAAFSGTLAGAISPHDGPSDAARSSNHALSPEEVIYG